MEHEQDIFYKIKVTTSNGIMLTYTVSTYKIIDRCLIEFTDRYTNDIRQFPLINCEIIKVIR